MLKNYIKKSVLTNSNKFSVGVNFNLLMLNNSLKKYISTGIQTYKDLPFYIDCENKKKEEFHQLLIKQYEKYQIKNYLYQHFLDINKKLGNSDDLIKYYGDLEFIKIPSTNKYDSTLNMLHEVKLNEKMTKIIDRIHKVHGKTTSTSSFSPNNNLNLLKSEIKELILMIENEGKYNSDYDENKKQLDMSTVLKYVMSHHSNELLYLDIPFIQEIIINYFNILNSYSEIPLDVVKNNQMLIIRIIDNVCMQRDEFFNLINYNGVFNAHLKRTIENFLLTILKLSGDKSVDLSTAYFTIAFYNLKLKDYEKCEQYAVKCNGIINNYAESNKDLNYLFSQYLVGELYIQHYKDFKQAYLILSESFIILKENTNLDENFEFLRIKISERIAELSAIEPKKVIDTYEYCYNNVNINLAKSNKVIYGSFVTLLKNLASLYESFHFPRRCYEITKVIYEMKNEKNQNTNEELDKLINLFKYSDDFNIKVNFLSSGYSSFPEYNNFLDTFSNFLLTLMNHSIKSKNFESAKIICSILEQNITKITNENFLINYHNFASILMRNIYDMDSSAAHVLSSIAIVHNSESLMLDPKLKYMTLIRLYFNLGYIYILNDKISNVIENFENCLRNIIEVENFITNINEKIKLFEFSSTIQFCISNFYFKNNEKHKSSDQLLSISEILKKSEGVLSDDRKTLIANYIEEIRGNINK